MNSLATGKRKRKTKRNGKKKKTVKHVRVSESSGRLMTSHGLLGLVRKEKIVQEVAMRSDMWSSLDDDFHVEVMNYIIIAWLWIATEVPQTPRAHGIFQITLKLL